jgi:methyl-accepting chemotaxis protein
MNFNNLTIQQKFNLVIIFIIIGVIFVFSLVMNNIISENKKVLQQEAFSKLEVVREIKSNQLKNYFKNIKDNIETLVYDESVLGLAQELEEFDVDQQGKFPINNPKVKDYTKFYEDYFKKYVEKYAYDDLFIICGKHGHVMYTQAKKSDYGENAKYGDLKNSNLGKVWSKVVNTKKTSFADMEQYAPSNNKPTMFVATPILKNKEVDLVLVLQISNKKIDEIMQERTGMGKSGETYLVGQDYLMRSDSFLDSDNHSVKSSFENPSKGSVKTEAVKEALLGNSNKKIITDYNNNSVLSAYKSINIDDFKWVITAEINELEINETIEKTINKTLSFSIIIIIIFLVTIAALIFFIIKFGISKPLKKSINSITSSTSQIQTASSNLSSGSINLSNMSSEQSLSVKEITATIEETSHNTNSSFESMERLKELGSDVDVSAKTGYDYMTKLSSSMNEISNSSQEINSLVNTIDEIAFQTNLLALNAAVEAARAGEHGLGFAVVSEEVRNLATRSSQESQKIHEVIEKAVEQTQNGTKIADITNESFKDIVVKIEDTMSLIDSNIISSKEQKDSIEQLRNEMMKVDEVTKSLSLNSEQVSTQVEQLNLQSISTNNVVLDISKMI